MPTAFTHDPNMGVPSSTTDTAVVRWSGTTGGTILSSGITIDNSNVMAGITSLTVDNLNLNGNTISSTAGTDLFITPLGGQQLILDGTIIIDAGVVTGATSITATEFHGGGGNLTGISAGVDTTGTPANNQIAIFTDADTLEGVAGLTFDGTLMYLTGTGISTIQRTTSGTTSISAPVHISNKTSQDAADGFGPVINFQMTDTGVTDQQMGYLGYRRDGADNSARFMITTNSAGTVAEKMSISATGAMTLPSQPAFMAHEQSNQSNVTGNGAAYHEPFTTEIFDQGNDFNSSNGTFTAPVTGRYLLTSSIRLQGLTTALTYGVISLVTSNRYWNVYTSAEETSVTAGFFIAGVADMDANDTCHVLIALYGMPGNTADVAGSSSNSISFSGVLVA